MIENINENNGCQHGAGKIKIKFSHSCFSGACVRVYICVIWSFIAEKNEAVFHDSVRIRTQAVPLRYQDIKASDLVGEETCAFPGWN